MLDASMYWLELPQPQHLRTAHRIVSHVPILLQTHVCARVYLKMLFIEFSVLG
jgi:hypothetical protein